MKSKNKLRKNIIAFAFVLLCTPFAFSQSGRQSAPGTTASMAKSEQKQSATAQLKNYKADASNPALSEIRLQLLQAQAALESNQSKNTLTSQQVADLNAKVAACEKRMSKLQSQGKVNCSNPELNGLQASLADTQALLQKGQSDKSLSAQQISDLKSKIAGIEARIQKFEATGKGVSNTNPSQKTAVAHKSPVGDILAAKQFTRAQFLALTEDEQRQVLVNMKDLTVTDLINATPAVLKVRQDNLFYIPAANFNTYDITRQTQILKNPSLYIMVKEASLIPKSEISRASFNALSPEKQRAIENSNDFVIIN
jgi:cob(I)alamin adenosyltransferase